MNTKKTKKKLVFNKTTIATLETRRMKDIYGGIDPSIVISMCLRCPPWWTDFCSNTCPEECIYTYDCM